MRQGSSEDLATTYGELKCSSFQKLCDYLKAHMSFGTDSKFLDIGSGLGKPNLHVLLDPGVEYSFGVEDMRLRWALSMLNLKACSPNALRRLQG